MSVSTPPRPFVDSIERTDALDSPAKKVGKAIRGALGSGSLKDALSGTWFGHAVHPPLTDLVIGSFLSASLLDVLSPGNREASARLIGVGLAAAAPTAASGWNDWADTEIADDGVRRVGVVHAGANTTALALYAASLAARRNGGSGRALALAGFSALTLGGYLGGHMAYTRGVGPNETAFDAGPDDWTPVAASDDLRDGASASALAGDTPVMLVRHGDGIHAIHDRCSHRGCRLSDGDIEGHTVTCACHGSRFDIRDGTLLHGPATASQPAFEVRESGGRVEVKLKARG